ncbi:MAG: hypothetical protein II319_05075 [Clostridia bacterium]|nr:hypothetical protein [Clostridia bacterium]
MFNLMDYSVDVKFWIFAGICLAILFGILGIMAIIEAIAERRERAEERRRAHKRYNTAIRPARRY